MEESSEKTKWKVARPNDKLMVGARMIYTRGMEDCEVERYRCRHAVRVLAGGRVALFIHPSDRVNPDKFGDDGSDQGQRAAPL